MNREIERKFLVANAAWQAQVTARSVIAQGYLFVAPDSSARVRMNDGKAFLTVKFGAAAMVRDEFEYEIPVDDGAALLVQVDPERLIRKVRHLVPHNAALMWEIDVFEGALTGLTVAELELPSEDYVIDLPAWLGREVTADRRFLNKHLQGLDQAGLRALLAEQG